jgi:hypothetical protein
MKETGTRRKEWVRPTMLLLIIKILVPCATAPTSSHKTNEKIHYIHKRD